MLAGYNGKQLRQFLCTSECFLRIGTYVSPFDIFNSEGIGARVTKTGRYNLHYAFSTISHSDKSALEELTGWVEKSCTRSTPVGFHSPPVGLQKKTFFRYVRVAKLTKI